MVAKIQGNEIGRVLNDSYRSRCPHLPVSYFPVENLAATWPHLTLPFVADWASAAFAGYFVLHDSIVTLSHATQPQIKNWPLK